MMTIELTGEQETMVLRLAADSEKSPEQVVAQALGQLEWMLEDEAERRVLAERVEDAERGDLLSEAEMHRRFLSMLRPA